MPMFAARKELTAEEALSRCEALCARCEQSSGDILAKLARWGICEEQAAGILRHLVADGYVDDARYARAYVRDKFRFSGWGRLKIAYNLRMKRVDNSSIYEAMQEIDDGEYVTKLEDLLKSKYRDVKSKPALQARAALMRFAAQRGFENDVAMPVIRQLAGGEIIDF